MKIHIVQKGDTLWKIAKKYGVNFEELKKMNTQLSNPDMIMPGMKIKVPGSGGSIKKEAPISGANVNFGSKKEMPKKEQPKEKPQTLPAKEAPKQVAPKAEQKKPYKPKMPKQILPDIDINNYYMLNFDNVAPQKPLPKQKPLKPIQEQKPLKPVEQQKPLQPIQQ
ncbi:SafA/ExsA family spore coat assembly protein, partial [Cytobacillus horneckiae]